MTRVTRLGIVLALTTGCASLDWGTYPRASGPGVTPQDPPGECKAEVATPDIQAEIELRLYQPSFELVGPLYFPVLPFVPFPFWPSWEELEISIRLNGGTDGAFVVPESLRLSMGGRAYAPTSIRVISSGHPDLWKPGSNQPVFVETHDWIVYDYKYLGSPREPFSISVDGLPRIDFVPVSDWRYRLWTGEPRTAPRPLAVQVREVAVEWAGKGKVIMGVEFKGE